MNKFKAKSLENYTYRCRRAWNSLISKNRVLPDFIIIGAQRCGTTSLFSFLCDLGEVFNPIKKEIHFFDNFYHKGIGWYKSHFPVTSRKQKIVGEASPYYIFHPQAMERMATTVPESKVIVVLRDPVERAFSHYKWEVRQGYETLSFEKALDEEETRLQGEIEKLKNNSQYYSLDYQHYSYTSRGMYYDQIKRLYKLIDPANCLILSSEEIFSGHQEAFSKLQDFLGLTHLNYKDFKEINATKSSIMQEVTRARLKELFRSENQKLYELLGKDFGWN